MLLPDLSLAMDPAVVDVAAEVLGSANAVLAAALGIAISTLPEIAGPVWKQIAHRMASIRRRLQQLGNSDWHRTFDTKLASRRAAAKE